MQVNSSFQNKNQEDGLDIKEQFDNYLKHWIWFVISILICTTIALLYLRYTVPQYQASATILVKDEKKGSLESELSAFSDLGLTKGIKSNVDNEIEIIKSFSIIKSAVKKLNFNVFYYTEGRLKRIELYDEKPIDVSFFESDDTFFEKNQSYIINSKSKTTFELANFAGKKIKEFKYGSLIRLGNCKMVVTKKLQSSQDNEDFSITVNISNLDKVAKSYKNRLGKIGRAHV